MDRSRGRDSAMARSLGGSLANSKEIVGYDRKGKRRSIRQFSTVSADEEEVLAETPDALSRFQHRQDIPCRILEPCNRRTVPTRNSAGVRFQVRLVVDFESHAALA
jgi:hypothetical protein